MPDLKPIRHIAGPYTDLVQQCTRCLYIIIDNRNTMYAGDGPPPRGFPEGIVIVEDGWPIRMSAGDEEDAVDCEPMDIVEAFEHDEEHP